MANGRKNKSKAKKAEKPLYESARNWAALAASLKTGSGAHGSKNMKRNRTRSSQKRQAISDEW